MAAANPGDPPVTRAVLLAAGLGDRLQHHTASIPKPLVPVDGRPLVSYTLDALATAGIREIVAVTGYRGEPLRRALDALSPMPVSFRHNPNYRLGASCSLAAAREACGDEPFLLVMSDHLVAPALVERLIEHGPRDGASVAADSSIRDPAYVEEATRVLTDAGGLVRDIGKGLREWNFLDAGAFVCGPATWDAVEQAPFGCNLSDVFRILARQRRFYAADITGAFWYDVDTPEDRAIAEALLRDGLDPTAAPAG